MQMKGTYNSRKQNSVNNETQNVTKVWNICGQY